MQVYAIGMNNAKYIKVGISKRPYKRMASLQAGNPKQLTMLLTEEGTFDEEHGIHDMLRRYRMEGEWFDNSDGTPLDLVHWHFDLPVLKVDRMVYFGLPTP